MAVVPITGDVILSAPDMRHAIVAERVLLDDVNVGAPGTPVPVYHRIFSPFAEFSSRISVQSVNAFSVADVDPISIVMRVRSVEAMLAGSVMAWLVPAVVTAVSAVLTTVGDAT